MSWAGLAFRAGYAVVRRLAPLVRLGMRANLGYFRPFVELRLTGRRSGRPRPAIVTLLVVDDRWYVGHPNGPAPWTRNLVAADVVDMHRTGAPAVRVHAIPLPDGPERDRVIHATARLQPFPARLLYRAARGHILRVGVYYRLHEVASGSAPP
jgi:deazaflavin-dependent oxidoreductase (nitroreductase family)